MKKKNNLYLASPFFTLEQEELERLVANALQNNISVSNVFQPKNIQAENEFGTDAWKKEIFEKDTLAIKSCDVMVAIVNFIDKDGEIIPDPGTTWELGYANALNKPIVLLDFGHNPEETVLNVMVDMGTHYHMCLNKEDIQNIIFELNFNTLTINRKDWKTT